MTDLLGRPISGDIDSGYNRTKVEQLGAPEFLEALDNLLGVEGVVSVRWRQYTPYF